MGWTLWLVTPYGPLWLGPSWTPLILSGVHLLGCVCLYGHTCARLFATMVCEWFVVAWVTELFNQKACRPGWVKRLCP